ncbi:MAG: protein-L-isoaspartate(D-aspartate) O-methyltransferase, partial [Planctomycetota bacterium]|nr:protein-L-isoaspartate(D-aspartate) O-methyltransferase [Planctomycetota bacterium]
HEFMPLSMRNKAYLDAGIPIGASQTISSPFIVAYMTESLEPKPTDKVLEIGTGSGYQAAVLSPLVKEVYSIEIVKSLGERAARTLRRLKYKNVFTKVGDGFKGWKEHAPFDKIIVTCSPERIPLPLIEQLREGGLMVVPVGERYQQTLYLLKKNNGKLDSIALRPTLFVPMTGNAEDARIVKPDPLNPKIANGDFELKPKNKEFMPGWYYQRKLKWVEDKAAPKGNHFITFANDEQGKASHLMQGFAINGQKVKNLKLSLSFKCQDIRTGLFPYDLPGGTITFYDELRRDLGQIEIGPFRGTQDWKRYYKTSRVPPKAREALIRIGLFGATGEASFDDIRLTVDP